MGRKGFLIYLMQCVCDMWLRYIEGFVLTWTLSGVPKLFLICFRAWVGFNGWRRGMLDLTLWVDGGVGHLAGFGQ